MLAPHRYYYLHNFERALQWLGQRYGDVLDAQEQQFLADFAALPPRKLHSAKPVESTGGTNA